MAAFPSDICVIVAGYSEEFDASVERTEMERGVPKQRLVNSQVLTKLKCALLFDSSAKADAFEAWYFGTIKRIGWFALEHPRTKATINVRFENGSIGELVPVNNNRRRWRRNVVFEYMR